MPLDYRILLGALLIFVVRIISITLSTFRVLLMMARSQRALVSAIAFVEALTFALTFGYVAQDLTNIWYLVAYSGGFAAGTWIGQSIEERLGRGWATVNIISMGNSLPIAEAIREAGFGATRTSAEGSSGMVGLVWVVVRRRDVPLIVDMSTNIDPKAFVTIEETRSVRQGHFNYGRR